MNPLEKLMSSETYEDYGVAFVCTECGSQKHVSVEYDGYGGYDYCDPNIRDSGIVVCGCGHEMEEL